MCVGGISGWFDGIHGVFILFYVVGWWYVWWISGICFGLVVSLVGGIFGWYGSIYGVL